MTTRQQTKNRCTSLYVSTKGSTDRILRCNKKVNHASQGHTNETAGWECGWSTEQQSGVA